MGECLAAAHCTIRGMLLFGLGENPWFWAKKRFQLVFDGDFAGPEPSPPPQL
jgi:hypothetical protein